MTKPILYKYFVKAAGIGVLSFLVFGMITMSVVDYFESDQSGLLYDFVTGDIQDAVVKDLSDVQDVDGDIRMDSPEYGSAMAKIKFVLATRAEERGIISTLYDADGETVLADSSRGVFAIVGPKGQKKIYVSDYNDEWKKIFDAYDSYTQMLMDKKLAKHLEGVDSSVIGVMDPDWLELDVEEIYVKGGTFIPGRVHVTVKGTYSSRSDGIVTEVESVNMTPENVDEYEKIVIGGEKNEMLGPLLLGIPKEHAMWKDYEYYLKCRMNEDEVSNFANLQINKKIFHHLKGTFESVDIENGRDSQTLWLFTMMDYGFLNPHATGDVEKRTFRLRVGVGGFVVFLVVACMIGTFCYMREKSAYEIKCYQVETTNAMAHDLRTPITAISGYAENLLEQVHVEKREYYAKAILADIDYMDQMIHDILELSKSENQREPLEPEDIACHAFIEQEIAYFKRVIAERKLTVSITGDKKLHVDRKRLKSLVDNLLSNAVKYAAEDSEINVVIKDREIRFANKLEEPLEKTADELVKPYVKGDNSRGNKQGSGVGLAIVQNVAKQIHYKVSYEITDVAFVVVLQF